MLTCKLRVAIASNIAYNMRVVKYFFRRFLVFNQRLRLTRMARHFTQQRLADSVSIALRTYQCYEQGVREPSLALLVRLADVLEVPTDYLLCRDLSLLKSFDEPL